MKPALGLLLFTMLCCLFLPDDSIAQHKIFPSDKLTRETFTPSLPNQPVFFRTTPYRSNGKRASQYTAEDWGKVIDSTWGPGQGAAAQTNIFDTFWDAIDQQWAGFPNYSGNWDSLRNVYRPQIGSGLSRGRFYALMSRMWLGLCELHSIIDDQNIERSFGLDSFQYRPGVPLMIVGARLPSLLGAAVTPLSDSTNLVYRVAPGNPLGLVPGDLVLGYEGIPWKRLYRQLLDAGVPVSAPVTAPYSWVGSSPQSVTHLFLMSVGLNWGMFDTIDVVKVSTGDTLHLPTTLLNTNVPPIWSSDQVPIPGVPMPAAPHVSPAVSWGIVEGTNVGYIYIWDWYTDTTPQRFHDAITDLRHNHNVDGLIIDCRMSWGGFGEYANAGLSLLFGFDPTSNVSVASRNRASDHLSFSFSPATSISFTPSTDPFYRPIALLIGPGCQSAGDWNALRMRFHPMVRSFGKPTNGGFHSYDYASRSFSDAWSWEFPIGALFSNVPGEGYLIHKGVQPDEAVWLTREGVARGEDDVVQRALAWITTVACVHDTRIIRANFDSVLVTAQVANPLTHSLNLSATLYDGNNLVLDSLELKNDGLHSDGVAGDSLWGVYYRPSTDVDISVSIRLSDITAATSRTLPHAARMVYTRHALLSIVPSTITLGVFSESLPYSDTSIAITNAGFGADRIRMRVDTTSFSHADAITFLPSEFEISPQSTRLCTVRVRPDALERNVTLEATLWIDADSAYGIKHIDVPLRFAIVSGVSAGGSGIPVTYALGQNYPNPFNPTTAISYQLPAASKTNIAVYDMLGREVAVLANELKNPGQYEVTWNAAGCPSGMYICRMKAGDFVASRKLLLLK